MSKNAIIRCNGNCGVGLKVGGGGGGSEEGALGLGICTSSVNYYVLDQAKSNSVRKTWGGGEA